MFVALPQDEYLIANGLRLHYLDWGGESRPPMVLLHGFTGNAHAWDPFAAAMQPYCHVLALDQRGHGDSEWAKDGYATEQYVADLAAFAEALRLGRFIPMGLSMGAINAMVYAAAHPTKVDKLVIVDIGPQIPRQTLERMRQSPNPDPGVFESEEEVVQFLRSQNPRPSLEFWRAAARHSTKRQPDGKLIWKWDPALRAPQGPPPRRAELWRCLEQIACPTLIVRGKESDILAPETAQRMVETLPCGKLVEIEGAGHTIPDDNPEALAAAVRDFLVGQRKRRRPSHR